MACLRFGVLGTLQLWRRNHPVPVSASKQRAVLAMLLLRAPRLVTTAQMITAVWGETPPDSAARTLQSLVSRLRLSLTCCPDDPVLTREGGGYLLPVAREQVDVHRFEDLLAEAARANAAGADDASAARLRDALALWRGDPLADLAPTPPIQAEAVRLRELHHTALSDRIEVDLRLGRHRELVGELSALTAAEPLRERGWEQLLLALYRAGRRGDALAAYQRARSMLTTELGVEPGARLQELHRRILAADPGLAASGRPASAAPTPPPAVRAGIPVPRQLPTDVATFVGRTAALAALDALLPGQDQPAAIAISAIDGAAGIGKTALAVHWAHHVADRFPDGQLYVNLRGFGPHGPPMPPTEAVRALLDALQVPTEELPSTFDGMVGRYRSLLAGRRMLVVLDNARDAAQVRPLLPGTAGCVALVTSRSELTGLAVTDGARLLTLDLLTGEESAALLAHRIGHQRVAAEPAAVADLVERCGRLPLALAIVAARAAARPELAIDSLAGLLRQAGGGLAAWGNPDPATDIRAVFAWSYEALSPAAARLFRLLALHPGPDLAVEAAASLAGAPLAVTRGLLTELTAAHLLAERTSGRYSSHDLLRAYATDLVNTADDHADRQAARLRLLDHCLHSAHTAALAHKPHLRGVTPPPPVPGALPVIPTDSRQATDWLDTERRGLLSAIEAAAEHGFDRHAHQLAWCLANFLDQAGHWHELAASQHTALRAAQRSGDRQAQTRAHRGLGNVHVKLGHPQQAEQHYRQALPLLAELGDQYGEAFAHLGLAYLADQQTDHRQAADHASRALQLFTEADYPAGQARALNTLGWCHTMLGEHRKAVDTCERALVIQEKTGDVAGASDTWGSLGLAHHNQGDFAQARTCYRRALTLLEQAPNLLSEAVTLEGLGNTHQALGELDTARAIWQRALSRYDRVGDPRAGKLRTKLAGHVGSR